MSEIKASPPFHAIITLDNPAFCTYLLCVSLLVLKMMLMSVITVFHRVTNKVSDLGDLISINHECFSDLLARRRFGSWEVEKWVLQTRSTELKGIRKRVWTIENENIYF